MPLIDILRRFLPQTRVDSPSLNRAQRKAVKAIHHCRTPAMSGHIYACRKCKQIAFAYHSCNHRACPQCGRANTRDWVKRELGKRINAPYFMVTFTLPSELREMFFTPLAKQAYDVFFDAASTALGDALGNPKWLGAATYGLTAILHTWNQQLQFHPHIHFIVPGAGLNAQGALVLVKSERFLVPLPVLRCAFRQNFRRAMNALEWEVDPAIWRKDWGVNIQPFGSGVNAIKYLGAYVSRSAIADSRVVGVEGDSVAFRWKDRARGGVTKIMRLPGVEFTKRYLRHVLPQRMHAQRYYGFCHPAARAKRERVAFHSGMPLTLETPPPPETSEALPPGTPQCPCCKEPMTRTHVFSRRGVMRPLAPSRAPPCRS